ncbi:hypothetical protein [Desulfatitalea alkaliphila]|uniref:Uncharacterized protein n=1 Tax=Desulfatitalea alkaliphila TaxID=2929485 RepID=A0AA41R3T9_9BACT|nr:hypothetical protein [Desulfatitalea alkaliphila]MCJ8500515.1 hypothetical protein [Desulfatitalea alkaliphila]
MGIVLKITAFTLLFLLVLFGAIADLPMMQARWHLDTWLGSLDRILYIRLAGLLGLVMACLWAWGYKRRFEASHKFRRSKEVLAQAEAAADGKRQALARMEEQLKATFAAKEDALQNTLAEAKREHAQQLQSLREQNLQLKDAVSKLMTKLKNKAG